MRLGTLIRLLPLLLLSVSACSFGKDDDDDDDDDDDADTTDPERAEAVCGPVGALLEAYDDVDPDIQLSPFPEVVCDDSRGEHWMVSAESDGDVDADAVALWFWNPTEGDMVGPFELFSGDRFELVTPVEEVGVSCSANTHAPLLLPSAGGSAGLFEGGGCVGTGCAGGGFGGFGDAVEWTFSMDEQPFEVEFLACGVSSGKYLREEAELLGGGTATGSFTYGFSLDGEDAPFESEELVVGHFLAVDDQDEPVGGYTSVLSW